VTVLDFTGSELRYLHDGMQRTARVTVTARRIDLHLAGLRLEYLRHDPQREADDGFGGDTVIAPMPGLVAALKVASGAKVSKGETLVYLEAMKMEHALAAPRDGIVAEVLVESGDQVSDGTLIIRLEP
jgi:3-methylcrotonyl-CoA carboxylase alpha subunit